MYHLKLKRPKTLFRFFYLAVLPPLLGFVFSKTYLKGMAFVFILWLIPPAIVFPSLFPLADCGLPSPIDWRSWGAAFILYAVVAEVLWLLRGGRIVREKSNTSTNPTQLSDAVSQSPANSLVLGSPRQLSWTIRAALYLHLILFAFLIWAVWSSSKRWSDNPNQQVVLQQYAVTLRSAIDTNEIEQACEQLIESRWLTNQPEAAVALKNLSTAVMSGLDELAAILTNPKVKINGYTHEGMDVTFANSQSDFRFEFYYTNGLPSVVRDVEKRLPNGGLRIMNSDFYENGKLKLFTIESPSAGLAFTDNGKLAYFYSDGWDGRFNGTNLVSIRDSRGRLRTQATIDNSNRLKLRHQPTPY